ncbi:MULTISPECIES: hypothetical protein [unclassified Pseudomonas]|jgi:hypothetical protein|uniref:hypothetical protein n=1 Tax=unclassified Pseudomonas TaxID=196821 RepID=UPI00081BC8BB|nr:MULTISPECIES: hypothetical protein [unclassified Pseudomonas]MCP1463000.1 hypothetical protein [Pseudomonas sp. S3E17]OCW20315.1 hypothetical protein BB029_26140 [Pseudomonas sp. S3E12]
MSNDYNWLFVRNNLAQTSPGKTPPNDASPDLITRSAPAGPADLSSFVECYDQGFSQAVDYHGTNYVYVRAKNLSTDVTKTAVGSVQLWYCSADNINKKLQWVRLNTQDQSNVVSISAPGQGVAVTDTPFLFSNVSPPVQGAPYNLIAFITDANHPAPAGSAIIPLQEAIVEAGNAAYVALAIPPKPPTPATGFGWSSTVALNNANPVDVTVALSSSRFDPDAEMYFIFDTPDANGEIISIGKSPLVTGRVFATSATLPANYVSKVTAYYNAKVPVSGQLSADFALQVIQAPPQGGGVQPSKLLEQFKVSLTQLLAVAK